MSALGRSSVRALGPLLAALATRGWGRDEVARRIGVAADVLREEGPGLRVDDVRRLWALGAELLGDPRVGLHLGATVSRETFDLVGYLAASSGTLEEALLRIQRYLRLLTTSVDYELAREGELAWIRMHPRGAGVAPIRQADEFSIAARCVFMRHWVGSEFQPRLVGFRHAREPGEDTREYEAFFGCEVRFEAPASGLAFDAAALGLALPGADPSLGRLLARYADEALACIPDERAFATEVRDAIARGMPAGAIRVPDVAKALATSERSLQRRLKDEGVTFASLLDEVRRELALRYLGDRRLSVTEVAYLLGYSEKATFFRAFRKWTGETPGAFRARAPRPR